MWICPVFVFAQALPAESLPVLAADSVVYDWENNRLIAEGDVEILYQGQRLKARRIVYDRKQDRIFVHGPLYLLSDNGVIIVADEADFSTDLRNGLLQSARILLNEQMQINSTEITRTDQRYVDARHVIASTCRVCGDTGTPLWEVRAKHLVHDDKTRLIYVRNAQFRMLGVPVFYWPRLRLPDPRLKRLTGFLVPEVFSSQKHGHGIKVPYFIRIGDHRDLTLTPFLTTGDVKIMETQYRQAFYNGDITLDAHFGTDRSPNQRGLRYYVSGQGNFTLADRTELKIGFQTTSDRAYPSEYQYNQSDRLISQISLTRTRRDRYFESNVFRTSTLNADVDNSTLPGIISNSFYQYRFVPPMLDGYAALSLHLLAHRRSSNTDITGYDASGLSSALTWERSEILKNGMVINPALSLAFDSVQLRQHSTFKKQPFKITPTLALTWSWPWVSTVFADSVPERHMIEPITQLIISPQTKHTSNSLPSEGALVELDEASLFDLNRFAELGQREQGRRLNLAMRYTYMSTQTKRGSLVLGRTLHFGARNQFSAQSGFANVNNRSDWLFGFSLGVNNVHLGTRHILMDDWQARKNEALLNIHYNRWTVQSAYAYIKENSAGETQSQAQLKTNYRVTSNWQTGLDMNYDFTKRTWQSQSLNLGYKTECAQFNFVLKRHPVSKINQRNVVSFGFNLNLIGFGGARFGRNETDTSAVNNQQINNMQCQETKTLLKPVLP